MCVCKRDCVRAFALLSYSTSSFVFVFLKLFVFCLFVVVFLQVEKYIFGLLSLLFVYMYIPRQPMWAISGYGPRQDFGWSYKVNFQKI